MINRFDLSRGLPWPCSTYQSTFQDVSGQLLFITMVVDPMVDPALASCLKVTEKKTMTLPIFHGCLAGYFWNYDNNGLKLLQLRFYPAQ